jgi:hypothetical protein
VALKTGRFTRDASRYAGPQDRLTTVGDVIERSVGRHLSSYAADWSLLTYQNSMREEIKSRLKAGNACYHSTQNLFVSQFAIQKFED